MTSLLTATGLIIVCWAMAKYNKSDNLFWILLVSVLAGMAGGAFVNKFDSKNYDEEKINLGQVYNPTQVSPANCVDFYTELGDAQAFDAVPASKEVEIPVRDTEVNRALSKTFGEIRGQPTENSPFDTS